MARWNRPLDRSLHFHNNRNMEKGKAPGLVNPEAQGRVGDQCPAKEPFLNDAVLAEIKRQSTAGCLLCAFEEWAEEDWD